MPCSLRSRAGCGADCARPRVRAGDLRAAGGPSKRPPPIETAARSPAQPMGRKSSSGFRVPDAPAGSSPAASKGRGGSTKDGVGGRAASPVKKDRPVGECLPSTGQTGAKQGSNRSRSGSPIAVREPAPGGVQSAAAAESPVAASNSDQKGAVALRKTNSALFYLSALSLRRKGDSSICAL